MVEIIGREKEREKVSDPLFKIFLSGLDLKEYVKAPRGLHSLSVFLEVVVMHG